MRRLWGFLLQFFNTSLQTKIGSAFFFKLKLPAVELLLQSVDVGATIRVEGTGVVFFLSRNDLFRKKKSTRRLSFKACGEVNEGSWTHHVALEFVPKKSVKRDEDETSLFCLWKPSNRQRDPLVRRTCQRLKFPCASILCTLYAIQQLWRSMYWLRFV